MAVDYAIYTEHLGLLFSARESLNLPTLSGRSRFSLLREAYCCTFLDISLAHPQITILFGLPTVQEG